MLRNTYTHLINKETSLLWCLLLTVNMTQSRSTWEERSHGRLDQAGWQICLWGHALQWCLSREGFMASKTTDKESTVCVHYSSSQWLWTEISQLSQVTGTVVVFHYNRLSPRIVNWNKLSSLSFFVGAFCNSNRK